MLKHILSNTRKPDSSLSGSIILWSMNKGHEKLARWGLSKYDLSNKKFILDAGCGGGKNISNLLSITQNACVYGIDYSSASVKKSTEFNKKEIKEGRVKIFQADVSDLFFENESFDAVTAFETIYFWPSLCENFKEIYRILQKGGVFLVCNEISSEKDAEKWKKYIDMSVYTKSMIADFMKTAGFSDINIHSQPKNGWICVTGIKN
ncbi:class I SAM-dependent methyltransferase [Methanomicrobium antiquum]|uniref:Class I SAM-dependent methyltransferase n=1 Tax=Methanomicrobium antiquum TaxID=487686 RepID=A0AAF0FNC3_9EURY|nr:class I SAM-dependent methyltransferase [Methanomicrobium antiquum]WFN36637.1 class I SAM-dependent methyltransferase [Methanomicrobium antiquum]